MMMSPFSSSSIVHTYDGIHAPRIRIDATTVSSEHSIINWKNKPTFLCFIQIPNFQEASLCDFRGKPPCFNRYSFSATVSQCLQDQMNELLRSRDARGNYNLRFCLPWKIINSSIFYNRPLEPFTVPVLGAERIQFSPAVFQCSSAICALCYD